MYVSKNKKESAKQIGQAISQGAKISCDPIEKHTAVTDVDVLFLGCELFFGKVRGQMKNLAKKIDPGQIKQVVVFTISSSPDKTCLAEMKEILEPKGIKVSESEFVCKKKITDKELNDAKEFGATVVTNAKKGI